MSSYLDVYIYIFSSCFQSVKILTYREPQNPEYTEFVSNLKTDARKMFNYTIEDSLVRSVSVCPPLVWKCEREYDKRLGQRRSEALKSTGVTFQLVSNLTGFLILK